MWDLKSPVTSISKPPHLQQNRIRVRNKQHVIATEALMAEGWGMRVRVLCPRYRFKEIPSLGRANPVMIGLYQWAPEHCSLGRLSPDNVPWGRFHQHGCCEATNCFYLLLLFLFCISFCCTIYLVFVAVCLYTGLCKILTSYVSHCTIECLFLLDVNVNDVGIHTYQHICCYRMSREHIWRWVEESSGPIRTDGLSVWP